MQFYHLPNKETKPLSCDMLEFAKPFKGLFCTLSIHSVNLTK
ncbi:hypothetical protein SPONN_2790 [uncultured Candidatus Thioglobus sp.]|nr:hypothetical protein SPONN_2790 [uncultured Candidatus Thioglobus sp.]